MLCFELIILYKKKVKKNSIQEYLLKYIFRKNVYLYLYTRYNFKK